ncbi:hypothetical protein JR064_17145 [Xanthomonas sp. CFBP 8703]|uniref:Uncharacterized protein n=1 Tax=Xanthomonas bonasiae TaxID=2810351 RepID=A0ABS3B5J4_9XANT|nr:hypothetical protein [Xanthomonas bonasiae]MBN6103898.1 hypothetical protein [Xanthomonas bonasiae]
MKKKLLAVTVALLAGSAFGAPALAAENPEDQVGIQHNMYLGCLMDLNTSPSDALTVLVKKCGYDPGMPLERFVATQQPIVDSIDPTKPMAESLAGLRPQFSAYEFSFIERMDQIVQNTGDVDAAALQFEELEREAIGRLDPKSKNGALILGGLSVAKHSTRYWSEYVSRNGNSTAKAFPWKILLVVAADALGYILTQNISISSAVSNTVQGWLD